MTKPEKQNKWKEHLLKSGLPLEYEIKEFLNSYDCISNFDYTYFRRDKTDVLTEFSYDINSSYIKPPHFVDLMIECKYRHESTKWLFLPESYGGSDEINFTSFLHRNDHFTENGHSEFSDFPLEFAPLCSKGIEITSQINNPKTITQATSQLAYAMAGRITNGIYHQVDENLSKHFSNTIFYNVPIIVTTAKLFRIKENSSISDIKNSTDIDDIATEENCLVIKNKSGVDLQNYTLEIFDRFIDEIGREKLNSKLNTFNKDLDFVFSVISQHYAPSCSVVLHYSKENNGLKRLFDYIDKYVKPDKEILDMIKKNREDAERSFKEFGERLKTKS